MDIATIYGANDGLQSMLNPSNFSINNESTETNDVLSLLFGDNKLTENSKFEFGIDDDDDIFDDDDDLDEDGDDDWDDEEWDDEEFDENWEDEFDIDDEEWEDEDFDEDLFGDDEDDELFDEEK